jgi:hypothetical protein
METPTIKPFTELAECVKCGAGDSLPTSSPMIGMYGQIQTRFCPGGQELEAEPEKTPVDAILSLLPTLLSNPLAARKPRINICAGIGEEHLHKTCPRCGFEWLIGTRPA